MLYLALPKRSRGRPEETMNSKTILGAGCTGVACAD